MKLFIAGLILVLSGCSVVGPGEKGVRVTMGEVQPGVKNEGWYLWVPFITTVKDFSIRIQKTEEESEAATKDLQKVSAKIALNWHIDPSSVEKIYQSIGGLSAIEEQIINPAVNEVLKAATAKMTAEEVLTKRIELKHNIDVSLLSRLKSYNVIVDDVSLVNLNFTAEFNHAVEAKQIAEQRSKQAEYEAQMAIKTADAEVNRAKGQAEAQKLLRSSLTPEILQQRAIEKWSGILPVYMGGNGPLPFLNFKDIK